MKDKISRSLVRTIGIVALLAMVIGLVSNVAAAGVNEPTYGSAVIGGGITEWDLVNDYFAPMYEAGEKDKANFSDLYLRYECPSTSGANGILYALVLNQQPFEILDDNNSNWIKEYSIQSSPLVDGGSGNNGTPPDFEYIEEGGILVGWEASVALPLGSYTQLEVHAQIVSDDPGGATSSTGKNDPISLELVCPPAIDIEKHTNGVDADNPTGPEVPAGSLVTWTYTVTNTGPHELFGVSVVDDNGTPSDTSDDFSPECNWPGEAGYLAPYGSVDCTTQGTATEGQYGNMAEVVGNTCPPTSVNVTAEECIEVVDDDPSHYIGTLDYGDLPESFGMTTLSQDGARHSLLSDLNLTIGSTKDLEIDGNPHGSAVGDDIQNEADEEGVYRPTGFNWSDGQGELIVEVGVGGDTTPAEGAVGCLTGWLDFHDGAGGGPDSSFDDLDEYIIQNAVVTKGENQLTFPLPLGVADDATFFGRFRLVPLTGEVVDGVCEQQPLGYSGAAVGGEVEDQVFVFGPTAVSLSGFTADPSSQSGLNPSWMDVLVTIGLAAAGMMTFFMRKQKVNISVK
jgi:hypothetical protein